MADRRVSVTLTANINAYKRDLSEAALVTAGFARGVDGTKRPLADLERNSSSTGREVDRLSGRLRLFADAALTLGPALIPLGAATIPILTGAIAGLGVAAAGLGVSVMALHGVGDALKALDTYQADKSAENLQALAVEMERMGPTGAHFVRFLDSLEPELKSLQLAARDGLLPGVEDGITSLLTDLPQIRDLVTQISTAMGGLAADAGADLAGPEWESFFEYLRTDAAPTLEQFGRTIGNFAQGFADLLVGLAPATRDFGAGLEGLSQKFADWAAGLDNNKSFQEFVDYVRQSGPQAVEMLGALAKALAGIAQAMAPYGSVVLPVLTQLLNLLGTIASTNAGAALIAASAGLVAFNRAATLSVASVTKLSTALAANPWGLAAAAMTYAVVEVVTADDELVAATQRAQDALNSGDTSRMRAELDALNASLDETAIRMYPEAKQGLMEGFKNGIPILGQFNDGVDQAASLWKKYSGAGDEAEGTVQDLNDAIAGGGTVLTGYRNAILRSAGAALQSAAAVEEETAAIVANIDAMREKRQEALRALNAELNYEQAIDDATQSLKDNGKTVDEGTEKGRNNLRNLYALAGAWNDQSNAAKNAKGSLKAAQDGFVETATAMGMPIRQAERLAARLFEIPAKRKTEITMDTDVAMSRLTALKARYDAIRDKTVTINIQGGGGRPMGVPLAAGGTVPGKRMPYGDKMLAYLAPGEEVISNRRGQADRFRADRSAGRIPGYADGGTAWEWASQAQASGDSFQLDAGLLAGVAGLKNALKMFQKQLEEATKAVDREKRQRDELIAASEAFASAVGGAYSQADPFSGGLSDFDTATAANTNDSNAAKAALEAAAAQGLDGPLYQALAASGNLALLQEFAGLSAEQIEQKEQQFANQSAAQAGLGSEAAAHEFAQAIKDQTKELKEAQKERRELAALTKEVQRRLDQLPDRVEKGARAGVGDRDRRASQSAAASR